MTVVQQPTAGSTVTREITFPVLAGAAIVLSTDSWLPLGLPGHRGLVWLTALVAVALVTVRRETVVAVGAASTVATMPMHGLSDPIWATRYVSAAILLYMVACLSSARRRRWILSLAAGPIHLVALANSVFSIHRAWHLALVSHGLVERAGWHLVFGFLAGLLAWVVASCFGSEPCSDVGSGFLSSRLSGKRRL
ncbi:hypothetical protein [Mycobacterium sp.]|uniref:hypothetical protein n=1 Tax=Mycobacterium sp. TaxID=1785 RepID=UPI003BAD6E4E